MVRAKPASCHPSKGDQSAFVSIRDGVTVAVVGKYIKHNDAYKSIYEFRGDDIRLLFFFEVYFGFQPSSFFALSVFISTGLRRVSIHDRAGGFPGSPDISVRPLSACAVGPDYLAPHPPAAVVTTPPTEAVYSTAEPVAQFWTSRKQDWVALPADQLLDPRQPDGFDEVIALYQARRDARDQARRDARDQAGRDARG